MAERSQKPPDETVNKIQKEYNKKCSCAKASCAQQNGIRLMKAIPYS